MRNSIDNFLKNPEATPAMEASEISNILGGFGLTAIGIALVSVIAIGADKVYKAIATNNPIAKKHATERQKIEDDLKRKNTEEAAKKAEDMLNAIEKDAFSTYGDKKPTRLKGDDYWVLRWILIKHNISADEFHKMAIQRPLVNVSRFEEGAWGQDPSLEEAYTKEFNKREYRIIAEDGYGNVILYNKNRGIDYLNHEDGFDLDSRGWQSYAEFIADAKKYYDVEYALCKLAQKEIDKSAN